MKYAEVVKYRDKVVRGEISSNDLPYMMQAGIQVEQEILREKLIPNDAGGVYKETVRKITVRFPDGMHRDFIDNIYDAPWQVGGNGGNIRELIPLD